MMKLITAALLLAGPSQVAAAAPSPARQPPKGMQASFPGCRWGRVDGRTLSIWSFACDKAHGEQRLVPADDVGGFAIVPPLPGPKRHLAVRSFAKAAAAPVATILPAVLAATGRHQSSCRLIEHRRYGDWGTVWLLEPTGGNQRRYDKANQIEPQLNPCGNLGIGPQGDRFFRAMPGEPARIVYADMGSEIQIFDLDSLTRR